MCDGDKIYLVARCGWETFEVLGIYSTKEKADRDARWFNSLKKTGLDRDCVAFEHTVNKNDMYPKDKKCYAVWVPLTEGDSIAFDVCDHIPCNTPPYCVTDSTCQAIRFYIWAETEKKALEIATYRKSEILKVIGVNERDEKVTDVVQSMFPYEYELGE